MYINLFCKVSVDPLHPFAIQYNFVKRTNLRFTHLSMGIPCVQAQWNKNTVFKKKRYEITQNLWALKKKKIKSTEKTPANTNRVKKSFFLNEYKFENLMIWQIWKRKNIFRRYGFRSLYPPFLHFCFVFSNFWFDSIWSSFLDFCDHFLTFLKNTVFYQIFEYVQFDKSV